MNETDQARQFGEGPLSRIAALVYTLLVVELQLLAAVLPGLVPLVLLDRDASNVPVAAACALPLGPAISAALYALHRRSRDITDLKPAAAFWRGYRMNFSGVMRIWVPWLAFLTVVGVNLASFPATDLPAWWAVLLVLIAVAASLWVANALVITSLFAFRAIDIARLAAYFLGRRPAVTVGNAGLLVAAAGVTYFASEAVLALLGSILAMMLLATCRLMITEVHEEFVD
ncbi:DUF624 domain-containing protein [Plantactinospora sp. S1510]|uniref:DUF624 domain-containing protein n=1 Tax=Plantactinospora alkalitolerans TaxID=2789879 RepID=A0ABS0H3V3_9ACTN|nr:DUF624 domain-containing protein [Plantactinospora alkalitolerans]MBF9133142.1 DUF624 domain-containing protein [Plantactinospora alkalitolerans]